MDLHPLAVTDQVRLKKNFMYFYAKNLVRIFDLRHLEHSTIIYESNPTRPLLRLAWNGIDANYIAALGMDVSEIIILDKRVPCIPVARLANHRAAGKYCFSEL